MVTARSGKKCDYRPSWAACGTQAKAASALNHPNIVHIYDISEADGVPFIAVEYVAGKTLDQLIGRKGLPTGSPSAPITLLEGPREPPRISKPVMI